MYRPNKSCYESMRGGLYPRSGCRNRTACGRFTSPDPFAGSMAAADPQTLNRYSCVGNGPVGYTDPSGMMASRPGGPQPGDLTILNSTVSGAMRGGHRPRQSMPAPPQKSC